MRRSASASVATNGENPGTVSRPTNGRNNASRGTTPLSIFERQKRRITPSSGLSVTFSPAPPGCRFEPPPEFTSGAPRAVASRNHRVFVAQRRCEPTGRARGPLNRQPASPRNFRYDSLNIHRPGTLTPFQRPELSSRPVFQPHPWPERVVALSRGSGLHRPVCFPDFPAS